MRFGIYLYGLAAIATGIINIVWRGFEAAHEPIQAFGDDVPGRQIFAYLVSAMLVAGGAALFRPRLVRLGAVALGIVYAVFVIFWLPRLYTAPHVLGLHLSVVSGVVGGVCQQLIIVAAAVLIYAYASESTSAIQQRVSALARWVFGLSSIDFGLTHLTGIPATAALVPKWLPPGQDFWAVLTGIAFMLAGIAILTETLDVLASRLLALMLAIFSALTLAPGIVAYPHSQIAWGSNAYNAIAIASVWIFACWVAARQTVQAPRRGLAGARAE